MGRRADSIATSVTVSVTMSGVGASTNYVVVTPSGVVYVVFIDGNTDVSFVKSSDGGLTWSDHTVVFAGTVNNLAVWYDRWSGISADLIHLAYTETIGSDTLYRTIDAASADALSTQTTIFAGASAVASGSSLSITRARGGNVYCRTCIDAGAEGGFFRLPNANVPNGAWDAARTINEALATLDQIILVPGFAADNQDIMAMFWDASANEVSRQIYDDSANSWAETSIAGTMVEHSGSGTLWPDFNAAVDLENSRIVLVAWSATDTLNADLRCWTITESAITETATNVVLNSGGNQGMCGVSIHTGRTGVWKVAYCGKSDGTEVIIAGGATLCNVYFKETFDSGATWGSEQLMTTYVRDIDCLLVNPRATDGKLTVSYRVDGASDQMFCNVDHVLPRAALLLGV